MLKLRNLPFEHTAVLVVDVQADFTEYKQGPLPARGTDPAYLAKVQQATQSFQASGYPIIATQDWHPAEHISFFTNHSNKNPFEVIRLHDKPQTLWPPHCIQETPGAEILLPQQLFTHIVRKGMRQHYDSYSAFRDDGGLTTDLQNILQAQGIRNIILYGLTSDYCVLASTLDARELGYQIWVIQSLCRGVTEETERCAWQAMVNSGAHIFNPF
jgi:nicotinamidase/pyrazinamidase